MDSIDCEAYYHSGTSEIVGVHYQGTMILCVYRQPSVSDLTLNDSLTQFQSDNCSLPVIIVGDFNIHEHDWLSSPFTSSDGTALCGFCELFGLSQLIDRATRRDAILDLAISEYPGTVSYHSHLGPVTILLS